MTKNEKILKHLQCGFPITQKGAIDMFNAYRLSSDIYKLKKKGFDIESKLITVGSSTFSEYRMRKKGQVDLL